jgi:hypothetical protein
MIFNRAIDELQKSKLVYETNKSLLTDDEEIAQCEVYIESITHAIDTLTSINKSLINWFEG